MFMKNLKLFLTALLALTGFALAGCAEVQQYTAAPGSASVDAAQITDEYRIGEGDKVRITVYNEPTLTGEYQVASNKAIAFPLVGNVTAEGLTAAQLATEITKRLAEGYLNDPKVTADVSLFRPFYILGEVNKPGEYPYSAKMTVLQAVAAAQGFTYRADKRVVLLKRSGSNEELPIKITPDLVVKPGDTVRIKERYF